MLNADRIKRLLHVLPCILFMVCPQLGHAENLAPLNWRYQLVQKDLRFLSDLGSPQDGVYDEENPPDLSEVVQLTVRPEVFEQKLNSTFDFMEHALNTLRESGAIMIPEEKAKVEKMLTTLHAQLTYKTMRGFILYGHHQDGLSKARIQAFYSTLEERIGQHAQKVATPEEINKIRLDQKKPDMALLLKVAKRDPALFLYLKILFDGFEFMQTTLLPQTYGCTITSAAMNLACFSTAMASAHTWNAGWTGISVGMFSLMIYLAVKANKPEMKDLRLSLKELRRQRDLYYSKMVKNQDVQMELTGPFVCSYLLK
jgi:hypothetical protein